LFFSATNREEEDDGEEYEVEAKLPATRLATACADAIFCFGAFSIHLRLVYTAEKRRIKARSERFLTRAKDRTGTRTLSLSKELFFLHHRLKKRREEEEGKCTQQRTTDNEAHYSSR
jgi:hypothetical protein